MDDNMDELVIVRPFFEALKEFMLKERKRLNPWWRKIFLLKPVCPHINEILNWVEMYVEDVKFWIYTRPPESGVLLNEPIGCINKANECKDLLILCKRAGMFIL